MTESRWRAPLSQSYAATSLRPRRRRTMRSKRNKALFILISWRRWASRPPCVIFETAQRFCDQQAWFDSPQTGALLAGRDPGQSVGADAEIHPIFLDGGRARRAPNARVNGLRHLQRARGRRNSTFIG